MLIRLTRDVTTTVIHFPTPTEQYATEETFQVGAVLLVSLSAAGAESTSFFLAEHGSLVTLPRGSWLRWWRVSTVEKAARVLRCSAKQVEALLDEGRLTGPAVGERQVHGESLWQLYLGQTKEKLLTVEEARGLLPFGKTKFYELVDPDKAGLRHVRHGGSILIPEPAVYEFLSRNMVEPKPEPVPAPVAEAPAVLPMAPTPAPKKAGARPVKTKQAQGRSHSRVALPFPGGTR